MSTENSTQTTGHNKRIVSAGLETKARTIGIKPQSNVSRKGIVRCTSPFVDLFSVSRNLSSYSWKGSMTHNIVSRILEVFAYNQLKSY